MNDLRGMQLALRLAQRGRYGTSPNPRVGACLVKKGRLVGKGYHRFFGGPHAEIEAIGRAGPKSKGSTLYVTLEPCTHWGKTPPCVSAVLEAGIRKVVIGSLDPNPVNAGKGVRLLRQMGVSVKTGILKKEVRELNRPFQKWIQTGLPYVSLKMAQTLDGKIAASSGDAHWISGAAARSFVKKLRAEQDAILVGKNTLLRDNPSLSTSVASSQRQKGKPWRIILNPDLNYPASRKIFKGPQLTFSVVSDKARNLSRIRHGGLLLPVKMSHKRVDFKDLFSKLAGMGVGRLLVEGGGETAWALVNSGLVNKFYWILSPKMLGGRNTLTSLEGEGFRLARQAKKCRIEKVRKLEKDWLFEGVFV
ncbi:MAG: bifunctional diaminohydroxyphosphoribosylaminopyrimidine deaminase/5-amino-6-(5-phosphoribosylamino)uracil reductase RibD [Candidatus Omnitrophica bacterium]|nr:bifunctional diaminohydroxyphosphoribosylaminopyrimidine deaminase/5-amino-6-(5-phosphoribosylamino)uracil reductase RibD [Candidatus Omnitrophota bacterium]